MFNYCKGNNNNKEHIKWGFIGCGEVVEKKSGPAFSNIEESEVVAVMCRTASRARAFASAHNIKRFYTDAQELIDDPEVNAVYVATPPSSHATYAIRQASIRGKAACRKLRRLRPHQ